MKKRSLIMKIVYSVELICVAFMLVYIFKGDNGESRISHAQTNGVNQIQQEFPGLSAEQAVSVTQPIEIVEKVLRTDEIILVNKDNKLPEDYEVNLVTLEDGVNKAAKEAYEPLRKMLTAGRKEGLTFEICSSYRDVKRQQELFDEDLNALMRRGYSYDEAYAEVASETMPPGHSEHSTGLAFDIVSLGYQMLDAGQEKTAENKWLQEHCAEYGFILRYPKGKEDITAISYESWHFRYVGVEAAKYIMEKGITLEEYLQGA